MGWVPEASGRHAAANGPSRLWLALGAVVEAEREGKVCVEGSSTIQKKGAALKRELQRPLISRAPLRCRGATHDVI